MAPRTHVSARFWKWATVFAGLIVVGLVGRFTESTRSPFSVLLLTVESLRWDAVTADTTPNLWRIGSEYGARYANHRGVSAWTGTNVVTLLTGLSPFQHGVHSRGQQPPESHDLALELVADRGWRVAGLQAFMRVPIFNGLGLGREGTGANKGDGPNQPHNWLSARARDREPFFLWYHYLHTHLPYRPSDPFDVDWPALLSPQTGELADARAARFARLRSAVKIEAGSVRFDPGDKPAVDALYLAGVREFDEWFATLWDLLEAEGLRDDTIIVVTADHGEELLERGHVGHASTSLDGHLHEEIVRLPLFLFFPERLAGPTVGRVIDHPSDHADVMATLLPLLGLEAPSALVGHDLTALPENRIWVGVTSKAGYSEPEPEQPAAMLFAAVDRPWKLHRTEPRNGTAEMRLFNLARDPAELQDLTARRPDVVARLAAAIDRSQKTVLPQPPTEGLALASGPRPIWRRPIGSGAYGFDEIDGRFTLEWDAPSDRDYIVEYRYLDGAGWLNGTIPVQGTQLDFGLIDRRYWDTWVVPNGPYRLRVGYAGAKPNWSEWIELVAK